jgi:microcystin-dependent protein
MPLDLQYDILNDTPAAAGPVEANFNRTEQYINQELIARDGHIAMTGQLHLVGVPVADLDAAPKIYVDQVLPIGIIMMFGAAAPAGGRWLACDGTEYATADYPELFAIIGLTFTPSGGTGGRFNVPNLAGRMPIGTSTTITAGATGGTADSVGVGAHTHAIDHTHASATTALETTDHVHFAANHSHKLAHTHAIGNHRHTFLPSAGVSVVLSQTAGGPAALQLAANAGTNGWDHNNTTGDQQAVTNTVTQSAVDTDTSGGTNTAGRSAGHTHTVAVPALAGTSGPPSVTGTGGNLPPYIGVVFAIRAR